MIISFEGEYKSLTDFVSDELSPFSIITGKNGSGKSQLIELIALKMQNRKSPILELSFNPPISQIQIEGIENKNISVVNHSTWKTLIEQHINKYKSVGKNTKIFGKILIDNNVWLFDLDEISLKQSIQTITAEELRKLIVNVLIEIRGNWIPTEDGSVEYEIFKHVHIFDALLKKTMLLANHISISLQKDILDLNDNDFFNTPIPEYLLDSSELFNSQIENIFYNYAKRRDQNRRLYFEKSVDGSINNSTSDEQFVKDHIPPWVLLNSILDNNGINFNLEEIDKKDFSPDININIKLIKRTTQRAIEFGNLSSGEKIIIGLLVKLFTSEYYNDKLQFPELIILDEPDAHLHPDICRLLMDILNETFVKRFKIRVIITTHSPTTIALSPDNNIYELVNEPFTSLKRIDKDIALNILTGLLPTLSIDYENHKQVFGESPTDVKYYQIIFDKLNQEKRFPFKLYFMANTYGKGNCDQVKKIIEVLRDSGNKTSYGIIDWDLKNHPSDYIKVHGFNERYSIENYLYDPVYVSVLLMEMKIERIYEELNIPTNYNIYSIGNESNDFLQNIVEWFFEKYYAKYKFEKSKHTNRKSISYLNGKNINIPSWFLEFNGHDFEKRIKTIFTDLDRKYPSEGLLQNALSLIIGKCYPFIPKDTELLISDLINSKQ